MSITDKYIFIAPDKIKVICDDCGCETINTAKYGKTYKVSKWIEKKFKKNDLICREAHLDAQNLYTKFSDIKIFKEDKMLLCPTCYRKLRSEYIELIDSGVIKDPRLW